MKSTPRIFATLVITIIGSTVLPARTAMADDAWVVEGQGVNNRQQDSQPAARLSDAWTIDPVPTENLAEPGATGPAEQTDPPKATPVAQD